MPGQLSVPRRSRRSRWAAFAINVSGSFLLAVLPALAVVRRHPSLWAACAIGHAVVGQA